MDENTMQETTQPEVEPTEETTDAQTPEVAAEEAKPEAENGADGAEKPEEAQKDGNGQENPEKEPVEESPAPKVRAKYNKQVKEFTPEEASPLVEMGLKYQDFKPQLEKLKFLATGNGFTVSDMIDKLLESADNSLYEKIKEECGGNEELAKQLFGYQKSERQRKFDAAKADEEKQANEEAESEKKSLNERLAEDYLELTKEIPGKFKAFVDIPEKVVNAAIKKNISLYDAYLRYEHKESKKSEAAKVKQVESAKQSTGSLSGNQATPNPDIEDFDKAFHNALW